MVIDDGIRGATRADGGAGPGDALLGAPAKARTSQVALRHGLESI
jgi:hypothetical protein